MKVYIFYMMVLEANLNKTKAVVCTPICISGKWGEMAYKRRVTG